MSRDGISMMLASARPLIPQLETVFTNISAMILYYCLVFLVLEYNTMTSMNRAAIFVITIVILAIIAEECAAAKKKSLCRYRKKQNRCIDIPMRRIPRKCRKYSNIKGRCENIQGICELASKKGRPSCQCKENPDLGR